MNGENEHNKKGRRGRGG